MLENSRKIQGAVITLYTILSRIKIYIAIDNFARFRILIKLYSIHDFMIFIFYIIYIFCKLYKESVFKPSYQTIDQKMNQTEYYKFTNTLASGYN